MRTHVEFEGVGPSRMNNWNHPGGQTCAFGGAVIVQLFPEQDTLGKIVLWPILFPCVLDSAPRSETLMFEVVPWWSETTIWTDWPYDQSLFWIENVGLAKPDNRYGGRNTSTRYSC